MLGWRLLHRVTTIVTPDTIMRWHERLTAANWKHAIIRVGWPGLMNANREIILRMATDNSGWGYSRTRGELKKIHHKRSRGRLSPRR